MLSLGGQQGEKLRELEKSATFLVKKATNFQRNNGRSKHILINEMYEGIEIRLIKQRLEESILISWQDRQAEMFGI